MEMWDPYPEHVPSVLSSTENCWIFLCHMKSYWNKPLGLSKLSDFNGIWGQLLHS